MQDCGVHCLKLQICVYFCLFYNQYHIFNESPPPPPHSAFTPPPLPLSGVSNHLILCHIDLPYCTRAPIISDLMHLIRPFFYVLHLFCMLRVSTHLGMVMFVSVDFRRFNHTCMGEEIGTLCAFCRLRSGMPHLQLCFHCFSLTHLSSLLL